MNVVSLPDGFVPFLMAAKRATYAAAATAASVAPLLQDSKQLEYSEGEFLYRDIYVGLFHFVGQEIVYFNKRAVWSLSYAGGMCEEVEKSAIKPVYSFLRQALTAVPEHLPLRGPALFEREAMRYTFRCDGTIERFSGLEEIYRDDQCSYRLHVAGGRLL
jgi:hypothetical protein